MEDSFNLHQTVIAVKQAIFAVVCHMTFDFAIHGLVLALVLGAAGFLLNTRGNRYGKPLMNVGKRVSLVCAALALPGVITFAIMHSLPPTGVYNINSIGFIVFWSMVCVHQCGEEMNYCFWVRSTPKAEQNTPELEKTQA
jgi:hypothetical protein